LPDLGRAGATFIGRWRQPRRGFLTLLKRLRNVVRQFFRRQELPEAISKFKWMAWARALYLQIPMRLAGADLSGEKKSAITKNRFPSTAITRFEGRARDIDGKTGSSEVTRSSSQTRNHGALEETLQSCRRSRGRSTAHIASEDGRRDRKRAGTADLRDFSLKKRCGAPTPAQNLAGSQVLPIPDGLKKKKKLTAHMASGVATGRPGAVQSFPRGGGGGGGGRLEDPGPSPMAYR